MFLPNKSHNASPFLQSRHGSVQQVTRSKETLLRTTESAVFFIHPAANFTKRPSPRDVMRILPKHSRTAAAHHLGKREKKDGTVNSPLLSLINPPIDN